VARLLLGPLLRYVSGTQATVWVETDSPCEVEVLGHGAHTFHVEGHHYALVCVDGLEPARTYEYEVALDGERAWPEPGDLPPSAIRTLDPDGLVRVSFGSCRVAYPHRPPYCLTKDDDERGREVDALYALALRMLEQPRESWPHVLLMLGDQVYADETSPNVREFIRSRRDPEEPPGYEVDDYEEYARLYWETWGENDPLLRWLLSTVSTAMVWDDHDVKDDWNTSETWRREIESQPWWEDRISSAIMSYWVYQHIGNLAPERLSEDDEMWDRVLEADDGGPLLREFAVRVDREVEGARWSYCRDLGHSRLVVMDSRGGRVLDPERRAMVDPDEWRWIEEHAVGGFDHLLLGTSLPYITSPGMHYLEALDEALCRGAWGKPGVAAGERLRQTLDLEHWAAFQRSFHDLTELVRSVGAGERGEPPATIVALSGDVHHAYLSQVGFRRDAGVESAVYQAVCSPFRNPLDGHERTAIRAMSSRPAAVAARALARAAGVSSPEIRWRFLEREPWFDNQVATLELADGRARVVLEKTLRQEDGDHPALRLEQVFSRDLS
jgi:PhoD-like phosphatase